MPRQAVVLALRSGSWLRRKFSEPSKCPHGSSPRNPSTPRYLHHLTFCHGCSPESPRGNLGTGRWYIYAVVLPCQILIIRLVRSQLLLSLIISHCIHDWSRTSNHGHRRILRLLAHSRRVCQKGKGSCPQGRFQTHALPAGYDCTQVSCPLALQSPSPCARFCHSHFDPDSLSRQHTGGTMSYRNAQSFLKGSKVHRESTIY